MKYFLKVTVTGAAFLFGVGALMASLIGGPYLAFVTDRPVLGFLAFLPVLILICAFVGSEVLDD